MEGGRGLGPVVDLLTRHRNLLIGLYVALMAGVAMAVLYASPFVFGVVRLVCVGDTGNFDAPHWDGCNWPTYLGIGVFVALQLVFLRTMKATIVRGRHGFSVRAGFTMIGGSALALLTITMAFIVIELVDRLGWDTVTSVRSGGSVGTEVVGVAAIVGFCVSMWLVWIVILWWVTRRRGVPGTMRSVVLTLLAGSWIQFVAALSVDAGMRARNEDDCYCQRGTFWSLLFGIPLLLWSIGPGLYLLHLRYKREPEAARRVVNEATHVKESA